MWSALPSSLPLSDFMSPTMATVRWSVFDCAKRIFPATTTPRSDCLYCSVIYLVMYVNFHINSPYWVYVIARRWKHRWINHKTLNDKDARFIGKTIDNWFSYNISLKVNKCLEKNNFNFDYYFSRLVERISNKRLEKVLYEDVNGMRL